MRSTVTVIALILHDDFKEVPDHVRLAVVTDKTKIYEDYEKDSKVLGKLEFGENLEPVGQYEGWYRIEYKDKKAYVRAKDFVRYDDSRKHIALTFDDGPSASTTGKIQKALKQNGCKATFFLIGNNIDKKTGKLLKKGCKMGLEYANHTKSHKDLTKLSEKKIHKQLDAVDRKLKKYTGRESTLIRAPYGSYNDKVLAVIGKPNIMWSLDTRDWEERNTKKLIKAVRKNSKDGQIVLMHEIYDSTAEAMDEVCKNLKDAGFEAVTVTELAAIKGVKIEAGKSYEDFN